MGIDHLLHSICRRNTVLVVIQAQKVFWGTNSFLVATLVRYGQFSCPVAGVCCNFSFDKASLDFKPPSVRHWKSERSFTRWLTLPSFLKKNFWSGIWVLLNFSGSSNHSDGKQNFVSDILYASNRKSGLLALPRNLKISSNWTSQNLKNENWLASWSLLVQSLVH